LTRVQPIGSYTISGTCKVVNDERKTRFENHANTVIGRFAAQGPERQSARFSLQGGTGWFQTTPAQNASSRTVAARGCPAGPAVGPRRPRRHHLRRIGITVAAILARVYALKREPQRLDSRFPGPHPSLEPTLRGFPDAIGEKCFAADRLRLERVLIARWRLKFAFVD